jgi:hypothetical protein
MYCDPATSMTTAHDPVSPVLTVASGLEKEQPETTEAIMTMAAITEGVLTSLRRAQGRFGSVMAPRIMMLPDVSAAAKRVPLWIGRDARGLWLSFFARSSRPFTGRGDIK